MEVEIAEEAFRDAQERYKDNVDLVASIREYD